MQKYILRRLFLAGPTLIGVTMVVFLAVRFLPGNVIDLIAADTGASPEIRRALAERYSLNDSVAQRYAEWLGGVVRGDLGESIVTGRPVTQELRARVPVTFELGILAFAVSLSIAIPVGILSALKQDSWLDVLARSFAITLLSVPSFWAALLVIIYGFKWFKWTPPLQYADIWDQPLSNAQILWVPALILGVNLSGSVMRLVRSTMLEVIRQDYVRTARSKGLPERRVIMRHAMRNAVIPVITVIGIQVPVLIGGTVILETIFTLPGMGSYLLTAIQTRDFPIVQSIVLITASVVVFTNIAIDVSYALIDPRIRYS